MIEKVVDPKLIKSKDNRDLGSGKPLPVLTGSHWQLLPAEISKPGYLIPRDILGTRSTHQRAIEQTKDVAFEVLDPRYMVKKKTVVTTKMDVGQQPACLYP